ncbi:MAG: hypothetical protein KatS3mg035_1568 [Bacteroidia bacterium]|nr:MAG: hypothetical protein KatS3mg035_1568 [Bacteroidia bacterium]
MCLVSCFRSLFLKKHTPIFFIWGLHIFFTYAQKPPNDDCSSPIPLKINEWLKEQNNQLATINKGELPPPVPNSCINTFENDLWYSIETQNLNTPLQIIIYPFVCNTPAGVQAILYSTYDCKSLSQNFMACATKDVGDTIKFVVPNPKEYTKLMLYIDGFDGTICQFHLGAFSLETYHPFDFCKYLRFDYIPRSANWKQPLQIKTQNNQLKIQWAHENPDVLGYALQIQMKNGYKTLSCFNAQNYTFANQNLMEYIFNPDQLDTEKKCFRLLAYYKNEIWTSSDYCIEPKIIQNFWVSLPQPSQNQGEFRYIYKVFKPQKATIRLKNAKGNILKFKEISLKKGNFEGSISVIGLPKDQYYFEFCVGNECFEYPLLNP